MGNTHAEGGTYEYKCSILCGLTLVCQIVIRFPHTNIIKPLNYIFIWRMLFIFYILFIIIIDHIYYYLGS